MSGKIKIGDVSKKLGVSQDTLRYYEKFGLFKTENRSKSGFRYYDEETIGKVIFIRNAKNLGFSLKEIKSLLDLKVDKRAKASQVRKKAESKLSQIAEKKTNLKAIEKVLKHLIKSCDNDDAPIHECPILIALQDFHLSPLERKSLPKIKQKTKTRRKP